MVISCPRRKYRWEAPGGKARRLRPMWMRATRPPDETLLVRLRGDHMIHVVSVDAIVPTPGAGQLLPPCQEPHFDHRAYHWSELRIGQYPCADGLVTWLGSG